ncbi:hypothetical protein WJX84_002580 [Apatococcus fuscideae]|uniref:Helicase C-terminal domain-containing protein n=1 Tax=Apatococcus fuscideae TaxID=2026836 RepID=A0AAW1SZB2_9CHLO
MEDDDDDEFDSDEEMEPMIFEVEDDVSPELDEEEAAAGPSASARGSNALGLVQSSRRQMHTRVVTVPSRHLQKFMTSADPEAEKQPRGSITAAAVGSTAKPRKDEGGFTIDASSDEEEAAGSSSGTGGDDMWQRANFSNAMLRACKAAKPAKALPAKRDPLKGWRGKLRGQADMDSLPPLLLPQQSQGNWLHLGSLSFPVKAPWTPDQVKGIESESLLFHFMGPSSRFTRPGWETLSWPKSAGVSARWAEEKTFSWGEELRMLLAFPSFEDGKIEKKMAAGFVDAGPLAFSFYCLLGMGLIKLVNLRLEHMEMGDEPGPDAPKLGRKGKSKAKAKTAVAEAAAKQPLFLQLEVHMATKALGCQEPDGNIMSQDRKIKRSDVLTGHAQTAWALLLHHMLANPDCTLRLGPDCDGALNYCDDVESGMWKRLEQVKAAAAEKEAKSPKKQQRRNSAGPRLHKLLDAVGVPENLPEAATPASLTCQPKSYQLQGLQWMLNRERLGDTLGRAMATLHPCWLQLQSADGHCFYVHAHHPFMLSPNFYTAPIGGTCGGLLCDAMGLGKTLECLMLVLANRTPAGWASLDLEGAVEGPEPTPIKTTLAVVPANLLQQWQDEIRQHVEPGAISWCVYTGEQGAPVDTAEEERGSGRTRRSQRKPRGASGKDKPRLPLLCRAADGSQVAMHTCDLAFITYEQLRKELGQQGSHVSSTLLAWGFWRVLLDEAQLVAHTSSVAAQKASSLWRRHAWTVTGTPLSNRLSEIKGLLEFLAAEPFYQTNVWQWLLEDPYRMGSFAGAAPLMALLPSLLLRRTQQDVQAQLELPPCVHEDRWVPLSGVERAMYDSLRKQLDKAVDPIRNASSRTLRRHADLRSSKMTSKVMRALTELRQACCHPQIVRRQDALLGQQRLSMEQILARLTTQAFSQYDNAMRAWLLSRIIHTAAQAHFVKKIGTVLQDELRQITRTLGQAGSTDIVNLKRKVQFDDRPAKAVRTMSDASPGPVVQSCSEEQRSSSPEPDGVLDVPSAVPSGADAAAEEPVGGTQTNGAAAEGAPSDAAGVAAGSGGAPPNQAVKAANQEGRDEAKKRERGWQRLYLDALELLLELHYEMPQQSALLGGPTATSSQAPSSSAAAGPSSSGVQSSQSLSLQEAEAEALLMREDLGMDVGVSPADAASMRYSRRTRGLRPEEELIEPAENELATERAAQLRASNTTLREYDHAVKTGAKRSVEAGKREEQKCWEEVREKWHALQHLLHKRTSLLAARKGKGKASAEKAVADAGAQGDDAQSCPICLDTPDRRTLSPADLFDVVPDEEAAQQAPPEHSDFGSKTHQLLLELGAMRGKDPKSKAVVFSSWGRLLSLIGEALKANGIAHVSLAGTQPEGRANALRTFLNDPDVMVITVVMSTGGGAAGLTLNVANTVFLMEPSLNPGIEAQAAARVHRLGQTKSTRVIRFLAEGTIEAAVLDFQRRKMQQPGEEEEVAASHLQDLDPASILSLVNDHP